MPQCLRAFTLAETLIVIGIIGVVAALTLPNLNHATGDKEAITRVKKAYMMLTESLDRAQAIYGPVDTWNIKNNDTDRMIEFIKISKDCGYYMRSKDNSCFATTNVKWKSGGVTTATIYGGGGYSGIVSNAGHVRTIITADNMSVMFNWWYYLYFTNEKTAYITVDIDGPKKGENRWGYDLFIFLVKNNQIEPWPCMSGPDDWYSTFATGGAASGWVLNFDNMAYKYTTGGTARNCADNPSIILDGVNNTSCH